MEIDRVLCMRVVLFIVKLCVTVDTFHLYGAFELSLYVVLLDEQSEHTSIVSIICNKH